MNTPKDFICANCGGWFAGLPVVYRMPDHGDNLTDTNWFCLRRCAEEFREVAASMPIEAVTP